MSSSATSNTNVYQVSDLLGEMRDLMEKSYPQIWVEGECSSLSTPASGHIYFNLKDDSAQLRCAMFRNRASISRYQPKAGDLVRIRAKISVYTARGDLQCIVQHIEDAGEGLLQRRFEELKVTLNQQGLFDQAHKQTMPSIASHIGLITSPTGAAVNDVLSTLKRRCPGIPVTLYPAVVQGETAPESIIQAIDSCLQHQQAQVIILCRGGGSNEDLWCFNDERLANAIYHCPIPIISGVGHEVDVTIADLVADLRAPTPTAAAELVSPDRQQLLSQLGSLGARLPRALQRVLQRTGQNVDYLARQLVHPQQQLSNQREKLLGRNKQLHTALKHKLSWQQSTLHQTKRRLLTQSPNKQLAQLSRMLENTQQRLYTTQLTTMTLQQQKLHNLGEQLHTVSPLATLQRGFAMAQDSERRIIRSVAHTRVGNNITVTLSDGELACDIKEISHHVN